MYNTECFLSAWLGVFSSTNEQVEILVGDGTDEVVVVEAGTLGAVTPMAALYDPRLGNANGCDPAGCSAALTRVRHSSNPLLVKPSVDKQYSEKCVLRHQICANLSQPLHHSASCLPLFSRQRLSLTVLTRTSRRSRRSSP